MKKIFARNFLFLLVLASSTDSIAAERGERSCTRRAALLLVSFLGLTSSLPCVMVPVHTTEPIVDRMSELPKRSRVGRVCGATLRAECDSKPRCYKSEAHKPLGACVELQNFLNFAHDHGLLLDTNRSEFGREECGAEYAQVNSNVMRSVIKHVLPGARSLERRQEYSYIYDTTSRLRKRRGVTGDDELPLLLRD